MYQYVFCFFGDVAFSEYFCTITISFLHFIESNVERFFLQDSFFLPCDHRLDFFTSAYYVSMAGSEF